MKFRIFLLFLVLPSPFVEVRAGPSCENRFESLPAGEEAGFLGEGSNGLVTLVTAPDGRRYARKVYRSGKQHVLASDVAGLRLLERAGREVHGIRTPKIYYAKEQELGLEYVEGRTLEALLADRSLPAARRVELLERYDRLLSGVEQWILKNFQPEYSERIRDLDGSITYTAQIRYGAGVEFLEIFLKPDNVVVNPRTGEFTIVDPF